MPFADQLADYSRHAREAQARAAHAYARLLNLAAQHNSGHIWRAAGFLASSFDGEAFPFNPYQLRAHDVVISDDMLCCLDALRWVKADLHLLVLDGEKRVPRVLDQRGIDRPEP